MDERAGQQTHTPVILDGDPGHDDAIAWLLAFAREELDILAVVSVGGNASLSQTTRNMLRIATLLEIPRRRPQVRFGAGSARPLVRAAQSAPSVHGASGLDGPELPEPAVQLAALGGVALMAQLLEASTRPVTLVPTGPLTNVAALLLAHPHLRSKIAHISLMGGGMLSGNWTPAAEYNILVDPEAAKVVFESGIPITMAALDATERAYVTPADAERVRSLGTPVSEVVAAWLEFFYRFHQPLGYPGGPVHDPVAIAALVAPEILDLREVYVQVETAGTYCTGATIGDFYGASGQAPNARVAMGIDRRAYIDLLVEAVAYYGGDP